MSISSQSLAEAFVKFLTGQGHDQKVAEKIVNPFQILLEALSGIPVETLMENMGTDLTKLADTISLPTSSEETGYGGGGVSEPPERTVFTYEDAIKAIDMSKTVPKVTSSGSPEDLVTTERTMREASAPVVDTSKVVHESVIPNLIGHVGMTLSMGIGQIIAELGSIGQIDRLVEPLIALMDLLDADSIFHGIRQIRLNNTVFTPMLYHFNNMNPVMIPPYTDLIRMRVRENRQGEPILTQEEFEQQMRYLGYGEFWSQGLWDAHFMLPSNTELFTMYQYGIIEQDTLRKMLIINDRDPSWVDQLVEISKRYPTQRELRLMARRMPMSEEVIDRTLRAQGIRDEFFPYYRKMFEDWDIETIDGRRQTQLVRAYTDGILSETELRLMLEDTNASQNEIDRFVKEADFRRFRRRIEERKSTVIALFTKGNIDRPTAEEILIELGFEIVDVDHWLDYAVAKAGYIPELEVYREEEPEGTETEGVRISKYEDWEEIEHPLLRPPKLPPEDIEPPAENPDY